MPALSTNVISLGTYRVADIKDNVDRESVFVSQCRNLRRGREPSEDCGSLVWAVRTDDQIALFDADEAIAHMEWTGANVPEDLESFGIGSRNCHQVIGFAEAREALFAPASTFCRAFQVPQARINRERLMRRRLSAGNLRANDIFYFDEGMNLASSAITSIASGLMLVPKNEPKPAKLRVMNYLRSSGLALLLIPYSMQIEHDYYLERVGD
jgi:hypothetical protein